MARRALKLASWTSVALAASGICLYSNKYLDPNYFGAVRVGRAVATVGSSPFGRGRGAAALLADVHAYSRWTRQSHSSAIHVYRDLCEAPTTQLHCHGGALPPPPPCAPVHTTSAILKLNIQWDCLGSLFWKCYLCRTFRILF